MRKATCLLLFFFLAPALLAGQVPGVQEEETGAEGSPEAHFREANNLYRDGRFQEARDAYLALLTAGYESSDLYYNLGNAHFKSGNLGRAILNYERALRLPPRDPDIRANLELARSLTADAIEPMPRFWVLSALDWWANLLPLRILGIVVTLAWLLAAGGLVLRILSRRPETRPVSTGLMTGGGAAILLFGATLLARTEVLGGTDWGIILAEEVAVRSAPSAEDDLTLFRIHEGTKVRLDQQTGEWAEVVLEDGRVGWVPAVTLEEI